MIGHEMRVSVKSFLLTFHTHKKWRIGIWISSAHNLILSRSRFRSCTLDATCCTRYTSCNCYDTLVKCTKLLCTICLLSVVVESGKKKSPLANFSLVRAPPSKWKICVQKSVLAHFSCVCSRKRRRRGKKVIDDHESSTLSARDDWQRHQHANGQWEAHQPQRERERERERPMRRLHNATNYEVSSSSSWFECVCFILFFHDNDSSATTTTTTMMLSWRSRLMIQVWVIVYALACTEREAPHREKLVSKELHCKN